MEKIINDHLLKIGYELLNIYKEMNYSYYYPEKINELKRNIRQYVHRETDRRILHGDCDGYTLLIQCPDWVKTEENAEEWFNDNEYISCGWSPYDCTGQLFTNWYSCKERNGKWICYHSIGIDV